MKRIIRAIKIAIVCKKEGFIKMYCPSCGKLHCCLRPATANSFVCGDCGAEWVCKNADELFDKKYPDAGKGCDNGKAD